MVHDIDGLHAEPMEIDENLARAELSPAQEAAHIARRKEIWAELNKTGGENLATSLSDGRKAGPQHGRAFAASLAAVTGDSESGINKKPARVSGLGPSIHKRTAIIERAVAGEKVSAVLKRQRQPKRAFPAVVAKG